MTTVASPPRRRFLRQGELAATALGGILAAVGVGLLPPELRLVSRALDLEAASLPDILRWYLPILGGMGVGYVAWLRMFEQRWPTLRGGGWTNERDWAITAGLIGAFLLTRLFSLGDPTTVSGLHATGNPDQLLLVDAPVDVARTMIRFLASGSIVAVLCRVVADWRESRRDRDAVTRGPG